MLAEINDFFNKQLEQKAGTSVVGTGVNQTVLPNSLVDIAPDSPNAIDLFYHNLGQIGYNLTETKAALEEKDTALILSCAGSGKTTYLVLKLIHDFLDGTFIGTRTVLVNGVEMQERYLEKVFVSTFLKSGAKELETAFYNMCAKLHIVGLDASNITFSTLHAEYMAVLRSFNIAFNVITDEMANTHIREAAKLLSIRSNTTKSKLTAENIADLSCIMTYARGRTDDSKYEHSLMSEYSLDKPRLDALLSQCKALRDANRVADFEDFQELIYKSLINPQIVSALSSRYKYIFIDEFQDTSQVQYEILKAYIRGARRTIVIGDDDQCIYSWCGSDVNIIATQFEQDWQPKVHLFTVNYRCRENIVNTVAPSINRNSNRHTKSLRAAKQGGVVTVHNSEDVDALLQEITKALKADLNVGVLARTNFDLLAPAILLELDGTVPFTISKAIGINTVIPKLILGCIKLITRRYTEDFEELLKMFCSFTHLYEASTLVEVLKSDKKVSLRTLDETDFKHSCPDIWFNFGHLLCDDTMSDKSKYICMLRFLRDNVYNGNTPFQHRANMFCSFILDLVCNHSQIAKMDIHDLDDLFTDLLPSRLSTRAYAKKAAETKVHLTTVHEAKGKEWDCAIIWNDTDGIFPAQVGTHKITQAEYEEERRLHYIACTRAKESLVIFSSETNPSPYLMECDKQYINKVVSSLNINGGALKMTKKVQAQPQEKTLTDWYTEVCSDVTHDLHTEAQNLYVYTNYDISIAEQLLSNQYAECETQSMLDGMQSKEQGYEFALTTLILTLANKTVEG